MTTRLQKIAIIGGGSAGWMTAATLVRYGVKAEITLVESPDTPIVGVGESTLGQFKHWARFLGIEDRDFLRETDGSFKLSIKFTDFNGPGTGAFHYPFGAAAVESGYGINDWFASDAFGVDGNPEFAQAFFPGLALAERNRISEDLSGSLWPYDFKSCSAYHFDATKFGAWLRDRYCKPAGVKHLLATVKGTKACAAGLEAVVLDDGTELSADLFVDCTGWRSLLLGGALGEPFRSYDHLLPNNKAWAAHVPYTDKPRQLEPFTNCTALGNGWVWNIPLWSRIGSGYVYSDRYIDDGDALAEFKRHLSARGVLSPDDLNYKPISMRIGIHDRTWVGNVAAIGLSAGFIEPLESNGLFTVHQFALALADTLSRGDFNQWDRDVYNNHVKAVFDDFAIFVSLHYALSRRDDTEYWREVTERTRLETEYMRGSFSEVASLVSYAKTRLESRQWADGGGGVCVFAGLGHNHLPRPHLEYEAVRCGEDFGSRAHRAAMFASRRRGAWAAEAEKAPLLADFLKNYH